MIVADHQFPVRPKYLWKLLRGGFAARKTPILKATAVKIFLRILASNFFKSTVQQYPPYTDVAAVDHQNQGMNRRVTADSSRQRVDAEPTASSPEQMSFAAFQKTSTVHTISSIYHMGSMQI